MPLRRAHVVQDRIPSLRGERRALLIEHSEGERGRLAVGGSGHEEQAGKGDEKLSPGFA